MAVDGGMVKDYGGGTAIDEIPRGAALTLTLSQGEREWNAFTLALSQGERESEYVRS